MGLFVGKGQTPGHGSDGESMEGPGTSKSKQEPEHLDGENYKILLKHTKQDLKK